MNSDLRTSFFKISLTCCPHPSTSSPIPVRPCRGLIQQPETIDSIPPPPHFLIIRYDHSQLLQTFLLGWPTSPLLALAALRGSSGQAYKGRDRDLLCAEHSRRAWTVSFTLDAQRSDCSPEVSWRVAPGSSPYLFCDLFHVVESMKTPSVQAVEK